MSERINRALARATGHRLVSDRRLSEAEMLLAHRRALSDAEARPIAPEIRARALLLRRLLAPRRAVGVRKIRVGGPRDGAYVMLDRFEGVSVAFSLGVGPDVDWDHAVAERGIAVHQFDHTVQGPPRSHPRFTFHKRRIAAAASGDTENLSSLLARFGADGPDANLLKLDIEGSEWELFAEAEQASLVRFPQILCELHGLSELHDDDHYRRMIRVLTRLQAHFAVVHVHANNSCQQASVVAPLLPYSLEVSFANRRAFSFVDETDAFPTALDRPNDPGWPDVYLGRFAPGPSERDLGWLRALAERTPAAAGFDPDAYREANPDVARAGVDPWTHWRRSGCGEGRPWSPEERAFDRHAYLEANPDVAAADLDPLTHWRHFGRREGRALRPDRRAVAPVA